MAPAEILDACLKIGDEVAWQAFVARFQPLIAGRISNVVRRYGSPSPALIDDLVQETYLRLCRDNCHALRSFEARHEEAIFGYLKVIATSVALDHFRGITAAKRRDEIEDDGTHPEACSTSATMEQSLLLMELEQRLATTESERDRTIFWLYYRQGYTAKDIASIPNIGLTQKGVESCIYRLTHVLRTFVNNSIAGQPKGKGPQTALGVLK